MAICVSIVALLALAEIVSHHRLTALEAVVDCPAPIPEVGIDGV